MTVKIPSAGGVPGISGPPDWFSVPPTGSYSVDDVRWRGATQRSYGSGASPDGNFRAIQAVDGVGQMQVYLSFRAAFVDAISDQYDFVYLGLQKHGSTDAVVIRVQVHPSGTTSQGLPSANPPGNIAAVDVRRLVAGVWTDFQPAPTWVATNSRYWRQNAGDVATDPNNRWAMQMRIPARTLGTIVDNAGPFLATDFDMWYAITGTALMGMTPVAVILADYRLTGNTSYNQLATRNYPLPVTPGPVTIWDEFQLTSGPDTFGGVTIYGNGANDVLVQNTINPSGGTTIKNHGSNTFIARPRNYRTPPNDIPAGDINATFRMANWGSVAGDPNQVNWASGTWDSLPLGAPTIPQISGLVIPTLPAGNNPPATSPIALTVNPLDLPANKSIHQCVLVTLSGTNMNFLCDSVFKNMNFDTASLIDREAEISVIGLKDLPAGSRNVYLAVEKLNMLRDTPGANEGKFLEASRKRLMAKGGPLADKLKQADAALARAGDAGSADRLRSLLDELQQALLDNPGGNEEPQAFISALGRWLTAVKEEDAAAKRLVPVFEKLAAWLNASANDGPGKANEFIAQLSQWLLGLGGDQASLQQLPGVLRLLASYLGAREGDGSLGAVISEFFRWASGNRNPAEVPKLLEALRAALSRVGDGKVARAVAAFAAGVAQWLKGAERLDALVEAMTAAGLSEEEVDQLFPTFRVHCYHDTGERYKDRDGLELPVLRVQSSFGLYAYHEGNVEGWQTSIQGQNVQRLQPGLYVVPVPNNGVVRIRTRVQAVEKGQDRIPEDPIRPPQGEGTGTGPTQKPGCLGLIKGLFSGKKSAT